VTDIEVGRDAFASLPLTNNEVRDAPGIPQPMPGAWATSLFLSPLGRGSANPEPYAAPPFRPPSIPAPSIF